MFYLDCLVFGIYIFGLSLIWHFLQIGMTQIVTFIRPLCLLYHRFFSNNNKNLITIYYCMCLQSF